MKSSLNNTRIILASTSEGRKKILSLLKIPFDVLSPHVDEEKIQGFTPRETLIKRAKAKANIIKEQIISESIDKDTKKERILIISADSGVILARNLYGKPKSRKDAILMLQSLSDKIHVFTTAVCLVHLALKDRKYEVISNKTEVFESAVTFKRINQNTINQYLNNTKYTKYAGAYSILSSPQSFIIKTEGSLTNIVGLPLEAILPVFKKLKVL